MTAPGRLALTLSLSLTLTLTLTLTLILTLTVLEVLRGVGAVLGRPLAQPNLTLTLTEP